MLMQLDFSSEVPIYRQIHDRLVLGIASGELKAGSRLPTVRALANEAGVNVMTINKAYQLLKQEGYINADRRGGTIVAGKTVAMPCEKTLDELRLPAASAKISGMTRGEWLHLCELAYDNPKCDDPKQEAPNQNNPNQDAPKQDAPTQDDPKEKKKN